MAERKGEKNQYKLRRRKWHWWLELQHMFTLNQAIYLHMGCVMQAGSGFGPRTHTLQLLPLLCGRQPYRLAERTGALQAANGALGSKFRGILIREVMGLISWGCDRETKPSLSCLLSDGSLKCKFYGIPLWNCSHERSTSEVPVSHSFSLISFFLSFPLSSSFVL